MEMACIRTRTCTEYKCLHFSIPTIPTIKPVHYPWPGSKAVTNRSKALACCAILGGLRSTPPPSRQKRACRVARATVARPSRHPEVAITRAREGQLHVVHVRVHQGMRASPWPRCLGRGREIPRGWKRGWKVTSYYVQFPNHLLRTSYVIRVRISNKVRGTFRSNFAHRD
jgi:hypothetical protein